MLPMFPQAAVMVFGSWAPVPDRPGQVGMIKCCGRMVVMRNGKIICDRCDTVVELPLLVVRLNPPALIEPVAKYRY